MSEFARRLICILAFLLVLGVPLRAQENLDLGKTPAQLYASGCAFCHKSPQGLAAKGDGIFGLESLLRQHYTASRESAAAIAGYLRAVGGPAAKPARTGKRPPKAATPKGADKDKGAEKKPDTSKPGTAKPGDGKPADTKASETKPAEPKPAAAKPAEPKPAEPKPAEGGKKD